MPYTNHEHPAPSSQQDAAAGGQPDSALAKRSDSSGGLDGRLYTLVYVILVIVWILVLSIVFYLVYRRYRRNRWLEANAALGEQGQGGVLARPTWRRHRRPLLTADQAETLPIMTLTHSDIAAAKLLAKPSSPKPIYEGSSTRPAKESRSASPASLFLYPSIAAAVNESPIIMTPEPVHSAAAAAPSAGNEKTLCPAALHEENCAVCLDDFAAWDRVRRLPCRHYFHIPCIDPWLTARSATCPLCNFDVAGSFGKTARYGDECYA